MIDTTFTEALAQIAAKSDNNLTLARMEATIALFQRTAADHGMSAKALLTSLTEKADFNAVVASFWKKAEESVQLADDDKSKATVRDISVRKTATFDECGVWNPCKEEQKTSNGTALEHPAPLDIPLPKKSDQQNQNQPPPTQLQPPPQLQKEYQH